jgi:hypothetical protein
MKLVFTTMSGVALLMSFCVQSMNPSVRALLTSLYVDSTAHNVVHNNSLARNYVLYKLNDPRAQQLSPSQKNELDLWMQKGYKECEDALEAPAITVEKRQKLLDTYVVPFERELANYAKTAVNSPLWERSSGQFSEQEVTRIYASFALFEKAEVGVGDLRRGLCSRKLID